MAQPPAPAPDTGLNPIRRWLGDIKAAFVIASDLYQLTKRVDQLEADLRKARENATDSIQDVIKTGAAVENHIERIDRLETSLNKLTEDTAVSFEKIGKDFRILSERVASLEGRIAEALSHMETKVKMAVMEAMRESKKDG
jgi:methyl-accepting chemotaxis protein